MHIFRIQNQTDDLKKIPQTSVYSQNYEVVKTAFSSCYSERHFADRQFGRCPIFIFFYQFLQDFSNVFLHRQVRGTIIQTK